MPWNETCAMDERLRFVSALISEEEPMSWLCEEFGISRKTGYKWLARYLLEGAAGLRERSSAPSRHGRALDPVIVSLVLTLRDRWPRWGARKLRARLQLDHPGLAVPAASTIGDWLARQGLAGAAKRRRRTPPWLGSFAPVLAANDLWCTDFKGWFLTRDGARCDPLTVTDAHSRYLLCDQAVAAQDDVSVRPVFEELFQEHGLPLRIRSDNGVPFASVGAGGLSRLSVWWLKLGITIERTAPGRPQQNGRHERMHRTMKAETQAPAAETLLAQQDCFDIFRREYNFERPHEALGQRTPATVYTSSVRAYTPAPREMSYAADQAVRRVRSSGQIKWAGDLIFVGDALVGELVGVSETPFGDWQVRFATIDLGYIDAPRRRLSRHPIRLRAKQPVDLMESASALTTTPQAPQSP